MVEQVERNLGNPPKESSADAGYSSYDNLEYAEVKGLDVYMPDNFLKALEEKAEKAETDCYVTSRKWEEEVQERSVQEKEEAKAVTTSVQSRK
jgi:hypothetical protein